MILKIHYSTQMLKNVPVPLSRVCHDFAHSCSLKTMTSCHGIIGFSLIEIESQLDQNFSTL